MQTPAALRLTEHVPCQTRMLEVLYDKREMPDALEPPARAACPL